MVPRLLAAPVPLIVFTRCVTTVGSLAFAKWTPKFCHRGGRYHNVNAG